jgi:putative transposase
MQGESGLGVEAQRAAVETWLNRGRWRLVEEHVEVESGKRADNRPALTAAFADCRAYSAATREVGNADHQEVGPRLNNRAEKSHQPFRRRERAMQWFRSVSTLQKFSSIHAQVHNHFNQERHLVTRPVYKQRRSAPLAEWSALAA